MSEPTLPNGSWSFCRHVRWYVVMEEWHASWELSSPLSWPPRKAATVLTNVSLVMVVFHCMNAKSSRPIPSKKSVGHTLWKDFSTLNITTTWQVLCFPTPLLTRSGVLLKNAQRSSGSSYPHFREVLLFHDQSSQAVPAETRRPSLSAYIATVIHLPAKITLSIFWWIFS